MPNLKLVMAMATLAASQSGSAPGCALVQRTTDWGWVSWPTEGIETQGNRLDEATAMLSSLAKSATQNANDRAATLGQMVRITEGLQQQARNATKHVNSTQQSILEEVVTILESMYRSMDVDHLADQTRLNNSVEAVVNASVAITGRLARTGDIGTPNHTTSILEANHTHSTSAASNLSTINTTLWSELTSYISSIPAAPPCASLPASKTAANMKTFFSSNSYGQWYADEKRSFQTKYDACTIANGNLASKLLDCETLKTKLDSEYCAWKLVLEAG